MMDSTKTTKTSRGTLAIALVCLLALAGCGIEADSAPESASFTGGEAVMEEPEGRDQVRPEPRRVARTEGTIRIAGQAQGSLTERLTETYRARGGSGQVVTAGGNEQAAFDAFCRGDVDIVDSARPISPREYRACIDRGIVPVQFQVASDAAVLAIKNETDVGVDCLSFDEVRDIFRAGSPINSWSQVGYDSFAADTTLGRRAAPRLKVAGPDQDSNVFGFFGQYVLGDSEPTLLSVRGDYEAYPTDAGVRRAVVGTNRDFLASREFEPSRNVLREIVDSIADAKQAVEDAEDEVAKGIRDGRTAAAKARDRRKLRRAEANLASLREDLRESRRFVRENRQAFNRINATRGTLGLFRFSYYEAFEEQLRPMEVSSSNDFENPNCIFPSQATVTDATYPLSRQLLLTVNYRNMLDSDINDYLSAALANSQELAEEAALVPLPDEVRIREQAWLDGSSEPDVVFYDVRPASAGSGQGQDGSGQGE